MSRPYSKRGGFQGNRNGRGGGSGNNNFNNNRSGMRNDRFSGGGGGGRGGRWQQTGGNNRSGGGEDLGNRADMMKALLKLFFQFTASQVFDPSAGVLDITRLRDGPHLGDVKKSVNFNTVSFCKALCDVLSETFQDRIRVLRLQDNEIQKVSTFLEALVTANIHAGIATIDLSNNEISDVQFIAPLKKFSNLTALELAGNPVASKESDMAQIIRQLPRLSQINSATVKRNLLWLNNPIFVELNEMQTNICNLIQNNVNVGMSLLNFDTTRSFYTPNAAFSVSAFDKNPPFPRHISCNAKQNTAHLQPEMLRAMKEDFNHLRNKIRWRNIYADATSFRNYTKGLEEVMLKLKEFSGGSNPIYIRFAPHSANVELLDFLGICVVTMHGCLRYYWDPTRKSEKNLANEATIATFPFISCFFDRTITLTVNGDKWSVTNDMMHLRPDPTIVMEDGSPAEALFHPFSTDRLERLRRRILPVATLDHMKYIIEDMQRRNIPHSDYNLQSLADLLMNYPEQERTVAFQSPEALSNLIFTLTGLTRVGKINGRINPHYLISATKVTYMLADTAGSSKSQLKYQCATRCCAHARGYLFRVPLLHFAFKPISEQYSFEGASTQGYLLAPYAVEQPVGGLASCYFALLLFLKMHLELLHHFIWPSASHFEGQILLVFPGNIDIECFLHGLIFNKVSLFLLLLFCNYEGEGSVTLCVAFVMKLKQHELPTNSTRLHTHEKKNVYVVVPIVTYTINTDWLGTHRKRVMVFFREDGKFDCKLVPLMVAYFILPPLPTFVWWYRALFTVSSRFVKLLVILLGFLELFLFVVCDRCLSCKICSLASLFPDAVALAVCVTEASPVLVLYQIFMVSSRAASL
eukprot:gene8404-5885_t